MRIVVLGSATWTDEEKVRDRLMRVINQHQRKYGREAPKHITIVCTQSTRVVDEAAMKLAAEFGYTVEPHSSDWEQHPNDAGVQRVLKMMERFADEVVVFISICQRKACAEKNKHGTHGVLHLRELAYERNLKVRSFYEESW